VIKPLRRIVTGHDAHGRSVVVADEPPKALGTFHEMWATDTAPAPYGSEDEVALLLDGDEVHLTPHDVVIQRGTNHAWINRGNEPALLAAILIDGEPLA